MANIKSSQKDARRSAARAVRNRSIRSAVKTGVTKARRALADGVEQESSAQVTAAVAGLDRAVAKGVLHRNNAARRKARLMGRLAGAGAGAGEASADAGASKPQRGAKGSAKPKESASAGKAKTTRSRSSK